MIHSDKQLDAGLVNKGERDTEVSQNVATQFSVLYGKLEEMIKEREEKEQIRMDRLLKTVSEQLNKNVAVLFESIIQREVRVHLLQKIEKILAFKIDQKMHEIANMCNSTIMSSIEGKALNQAINRSLKSAVVEGIVPIIENGMNEIRLQVIGKMQAIPMGMERLDDDLSESKDETLDHIADTLKDYNHIEEDPTEMIIHLLETDIAECFSYVLESNDPEAFLFLLDKLPPDAEIDLENDLLVMFIQQMVSFVGKRWKKETMRKKYTIFLGNALSHLQKGRLQFEDAEKIKQSLSELFKACPAFGNTQDEKWMLDLIQNMELY
ncbi:hypothetical protein NEMIN01_1519 [Nematocida minor]|uniref:uncharacterized protein n=1 Tax=Nematocida minor TaxID=1912983 RepID=UPI00221E7DC4|nr:uncharacterized protein NEMIN01_1519 [Nematocida minor]KAI5191443.1 hypothetical protein NEMIN01_1519 [Nematocida minor]